ncbi:hypothetical protein V6N13_013837 [Hibiscus sabdariffa]
MLKPSIDLVPVSEKSLQRKRNMAQLQHKIGHEHPLVFFEDTGSASNNTYNCGGCAGEVSGGPSYSCGECGEGNLIEMDHSAHPHPLISISTLPGYFTCAGCSDQMLRQSLQKARPAVWSFSPVARKKQMHHALAQLTSSSSDEQEIICTPNV